MSGLSVDLRRAVRALTASPTFVVLAVLCLGIGIGSTTMMFAAVNGVLLNPLHSVDPEGLITLGERHEARATVDWQTSWANFVDWQSLTSDFAEMGAMEASSLAVGPDDSSDRVDGARVTGRYLSVLGVDPLLGRSIQTSDVADPGEPVVVLSESYWRSRFARDPVIVGQSMRIDGAPHTIVGVLPDLTDVGMPPSIRAIRVWLPLDPDSLSSARDARSLSVLARLATGVSLENATVRLNRVAGQLAEIHPENAGWGIVVGAVGRNVSGITRAMVLLGTCAAALVLLIACANVANLTLARAMQRRHEFAIRTAIGAKRSRIARQILSESFIVAALGAVLGLLVARLGRDQITQSVAVATGAAPFAVPFDANVMAATIGLTFLTTALFGLYPALSTARGATRTRLSESGSGTTSVRAQDRMRRTLVIGQVACSLALLIGASLLLRSFLNLAALDGGVETSNVTSIRHTALDEPLPRDDAIRHLDGLLDALSAMPGVDVAAAGQILPLRGGGLRSRASVTGEDFGPDAAPTITYAGVTPTLFEAFEIPLLGGRVFDEDDTPGNVAVINQTLANLLWPNQDPLGEEFRLLAELERGPITVIGVSADVYTWDRSDRPMPTAYMDLRSIGTLPVFSFVRTRSGAPPVNAGSISQAVESLGLPVDVESVTPMDQVAREVFWRQEIFSQWMSVFGMAALALTAIGIYGVLAYLVSQREREIGIRMALGADRRKVLRMVLRQGAQLAGTGVVVGIVGAYLLARAMRGLLFGVEPLDLALFIGVTSILAAIAMIASAAPAFRATGIDPNVLLRG